MKVGVASNPSRNQTQTRVLRTTFFAQTAGSQKTQFVSSNSAGLKVAKVFCLARTTIRVA